MATVAELVCANGGQARDIPFAPGAFRGDRSEYLNRILEPMLPAVHVVNEFHRELVAYLKQADALFLARAIHGEDRGKTVPAGDGARIRWTDNAPAWWWHAVLFNAIPLGAGRFAELIDTTPCEWLQVVSRGTLNDFGWHAAHVLNVKDRDIEWPAWSRRTAIWRFVRNVHPCNVFYLPHTNWQQAGADPALLASVAASYRRRYREIWSEFVDLAYADKTFGADAPDGRLVIEAPVTPPASAQWTQPPRSETMAGPVADDVWAEILRERSVPAVGELLASHPDAVGYTRRLLRDLTVERLIAIADALWNKCRPAKMRVEAPGDPLRQAELAWHYLFLHANKTHTGRTGWTGAAILLHPGQTVGLATVSRLQIERVAAVCVQLVRGPYARAVPH